MRIIVIILTLFCLSGCMDAQCIDADDFGFAKFTVAAKQDKKHVFGDIDNQVSKWSDTGYSLTGDPLVVVVKNWSYKDNGNVEGSLSAWCPWYGSNSGASAIGAFFDPMIPAFPNALSYMCQGMSICKWRNANDMCSTTRSGDADVTNAPCIFTKGVGLYALLTSKGYNPNLTVNNMRDPAGTALASGGSAVAIHIGDPSNQSAYGYSLYDINDKGDQDQAGGVVYNDVDPYVNGGLYFKILDKHYGDNSGQYLVIVKSGLDYNVPDPIQFITNLVATYFFGQDAFLGNTDANAKSQAAAIITSPNSQGLIQTLYKALIKNPYYKNIVRASLSLYIVLIGLYYLAGLLQVTRSELIKRVLKIVVVSVLLDPELGWSFFHDYLFVFFIEGVQFLISTIQLAATSGPGSSSILALMMAPETLVKLASLLFTTWIGIFYIILYLLIFAFLWSVMFKAAVLYLNCLIMIGMIIILAPIFLCFMLFSVTQSLYENLLKQLISYAIQPIILITILAFMSMLVRHEIYTTLGFPVCKFNFPDVNDGGMGLNNIFYWWVPSPNPLSGKGFSNNMAVIPVPESHMQLDSNGNETGQYCAPYECFENRYPQLPFLDPNNPADMNKKSHFFGGSFAQTDSLLLLVVLIYLLSKANMSSETVARAIAETSANATSLPPASIPYIPYDSGAGESGGGGSGGGSGWGAGGGAPRPELIKNDPLAIDSGSSKKNVPPVKTSSDVITPAGPEMLQIKDNVSVSNNASNIKTGSKDDSFMPYKKSEMKLSKRSVDDINIGTKNVAQPKVTLDFKAEAARVKLERAHSSDLFVMEPTTIDKPVLASSGPIKLDANISQNRGVVELSDNMLAKSLSVKTSESYTELASSAEAKSAPDLFVMEPTIFERSNLSSSIVSGPKGVVLSENIVEAFKSESAKPLSQKYSVSFEESINRQDSPKDGGNVGLKSDVSSTVTHSAPERLDAISYKPNLDSKVTESINRPESPKDGSNVGFKSDVSSTIIHSAPERLDAISYNPNLDSKVTESIITIEDTKGNIAKIADVRTGESQSPDRKSKSNARSDKKSRSKAPDYSEITHRAYDETTASKAQQKGALEIQRGIENKVAPRKSVAEKALPKIKKLEAKSKLYDETEAFKAQRDAGRERREELKKETEKARSLSPKPHKQKKPKSDK